MKMGNVVLGPLFLVSLFPISLLEKPGHAESQVVSETGTTEEEEKSEKC